MSMYGKTTYCADSSCHKEGVVGEDLEEQCDRYGIPAGYWHQDCWDRHGYADFTFDPAYAGERLEEDD